MAKKEKKVAPTIETMTVAQLKKHIDKETIRAKNLAEVPKNLGRGWQFAAESTLRGVANAKNRLAELEGETSLPLIGSEPVKGSVLNYLRGGKKETEK